MSEPAKILAVDDEPDFELLLKQRFRQRIRKGDLAFRFARHGEEALSVLAEEPDIGLLLLDINMPGMDGLGLLQRVKERHAGLPVIMVTAYGDDERRRKAAEFGASEFVTKPVDFNLLKQQLQQLSA